MSKLINLLNVVQGQINDLVAQNKASRNELDRLKQENSVLSNLIKQKDDELIKVKEQMRVLKLAGSVSVEKTEKSELKSQVNELVREVDRCIALLNK